MDIRAGRLLSISCLSTILVACGTGCAARAVGPIAAGGAAVTSATLDVRAGSRAAPAVTSVLEQGLRTGDYVVYRFSGSFRKTSSAPLVLTERVLGREGDVLSVELDLDDGAKKETLHIRKDATAGAAEEVLEVTRVEATGTRSATVDAYEAMMAKTILAADRNEEQLGIETTHLRVGSQALTCKKTSYRVRVGAREATMSTVESDAFPWGDVAGEIVAADGQVIYRVEVVDAGSTRDREAGAVAVAR